MANEVNLRSRSLMTLPIEVCDKTTIKKLDCKYNNLKNLPGKFRALENLRELNLGCNRFRDIPNVLWKLTKLVVLDISYNNLSRLPVSIYDLKLLETLDASYNKIETLPSQFGMKMENLETVYLYGNPLEDPPIDVCGSGIDAIREYQRHKTGADGALTYVVGDSTIKDINRGTLLGNVKLTALNDGTMKKVHHFLNRQADLEGVRTLIIHIGTHDVSKGKFDAIRYAAVEIRDIIKDVYLIHRNVHIVISGILPRNDPFHNDGRLMNDYLRAVAKEDDCLFIEHEGIFNKKNGKMDESLFKEDGLHLNSRGIIKAAHSIHKVIPILKNHPGINPFLC